MSSPPFWIIAVTQLASVVGDAIGQRAARKDMKNSSRHMLIALTCISGLQVFVILGILQLALPASITGALYDSSSGTSALKCYQEVDNNGLSPDYCKVAGKCVEIACPAQGPFSMFKSIILHPLLLLNGLQNIAYYIGEVLLYHQPLGVVLIVFAALASSFVIVPLEGAFGMVDTPVHPVVMVLGIIGAVLCVIEKQASSEDGSLSDMYQRFWNQLTCGSPKSDRNDLSSDFHQVPSEYEDVHGKSSTSLSSSSYAPHHSDHSPSTRSASAHDGLLLSTPPPKPSIIRTTLAIAIPFLILSLTYSLWFVTQKLFNNSYRTNVFGYTSIDQVLAPLYMLAFLIIVDFIPICKRALVSPQEQRETIGQAIRTTWQKLIAHNGRGFWTIFAYRFLINARAMAYFYLGVIYNLDVVYVELTLSRIVMSWIVAVVVCAFFPQFIGMSELEQKTVFAPWNVIGKAVGTAIIIVALVMIN